jgi:predicted AlkP superfamily phosphohydrolase/phosphomutase
MGCRGLESDQPLMDEGKMPNVQRLVENGCMAQIATLHPPLSPMLWTSIATGKRPFKHGIHGFSEPTQDGRGVQPITNLSRTSKAVWNILQQNGLRSIRDRLVAQPSRRADQRRYGIGPLPSGVRAAR